MKAYFVHIVAEDQHGNEITFDEVVKYPNQPATVAGAVRESIRERDGIEQVQRRMPNLRRVRAKGSIHI